MIFRQPLASPRGRAIEGIFGSVPCPQGCGRFALFPNERLFPPHLTDVPPEMEVRDQHGRRVTRAPCGVSGRPFR